MLQPFGDGDGAASKSDLAFHRHPLSGNNSSSELDNRCFDMLSTGGHGGQQQQHSVVSNLNASDYTTFFPNALAAAFLCPAPPSAFNNQRCNKMDSQQHPSPLFFQATGQSFYLFYNQSSIKNSLLATKFDDTCFS